jgi:broad-specificity NMP kinase
MKTYFVSGVNGVGKSTLIPHLRTHLPPEKYVVFDFDKRGVPDGADHAWRKNEIKYWLEEAARNAHENKEIVVCGFAKKEDFEPGAAVEIIVLDASPEVIRERLVKRYTKNGVFDENQKVIGKPVNDFIENNVWYVKTMREECEAAGCPIVDTSNATPEQTAARVAELIQSSAR